MSLDNTSHPDRPGLDELVPSRYALRIGEIDVTVVSDGVLSLPGAMLGHNADPAVRAAWLEDNFLPPDVLEWALNVVVVRNGGRTILIDAGLGADPDLNLPRAGRLVQRLEAAGIDLASVTDVVLTHLHMDHIGGLLVDGVRDRLLPGFGQSDMPERTKFSYTFDNIAGAIDRFTEVIGLERFAIYVFDYGAPTGFRLAVRHPERITAIISQNGNAYVEGLSDGWNPIRAYWQDPSEANRTALRAFLSPETTVWQYTHGVADTSSVSPDGYSLDNLYLARPGADEVQLDLFGDYKTNVALYPEFQAYFRKHKPPFLAAWGKNDPFFLPPGAEAFKRDIPDADVRFFDTGHFALETHCDEIAAAIRNFLSRSK